MECNKRKSNFDVQEPIPGLVATPQMKQNEMYANGHEREETSAYHLSNDRDFEETPHFDIYRDRSWETS
ncbi:hypothetical protein FOIG_11821 [Fusarium odoratissimum NRRL 54006]|jgi:hypothetical protein|uniref:Uncharacterized protein n=2 Tax=Fusarium oxysporum species complex TaxID=171631 RepID=X0JHC2_FUSO5|nr:uncharacterized protein FOIG_11821 [Fusarium odoratissimum NRRL 54006]EXL95725.1 hypothetical protein FOIG_11821 [Fusarium odoratissimum NRRL 54006]KAJ0155029.1 Uncharacterized protein HZ326_2712 [Fusarium oxysporum f. sp. albedinis]TXC11554.1 hypothetical protein FocTR4_00006836 [Fusarium oxysporum f. sp. cubense]